MDIRERREALGLSREALAGLAGCHVNSVTQFEYGYKPRLSKVYPRVVSTLDELERRAGASQHDRAAA